MGNHFAGMQTFAELLQILETKHVFWLLKILPQSLLKELKQELPQTPPTTQLLWHLVECFSSDNLDGD